MDRRGKFRSSAVLSAVVLSLLVWVFLTPFVLAPQAAPVAEVEPPPERMTRGLAGGLSHCCTWPRPGTRPEWRPHGRRQHCSP